MCYELRIFPPSLGNPPQFSEINSGKLPGQHDPHESLRGEPSWTQAPGFSSSGFPSVPGWGSNMPAQSAVSEMFVPPEQRQQVDASMHESSYHSARTSPQGLLSNLCSGLSNSMNAMCQQVPQTCNQSAQQFSQCFSRPQTFHSGPPNPPDPNPLPNWIPDSSGGKGPAPLRPISGNSRCNRQGPLVSPKGTTTRPPLR